MSYEADVRDMLEAIADMEPLTDRERQIVQSFVFADGAIEELRDDPRWTGHKATRVLLSILSETEATNTQ